MKIISKPTATLEQVMQFIEDTPTAHPLCKAIVPMVYTEAEKLGINPVVAVAQSLKETGYFQYKGVLRPNYCNIGGLKGTLGGGDYDPDAHKRFEYWEDGVKAFVDHLALYCGIDGYPKYNAEVEQYYKRKGTFYDSNKHKKNGITLDPRHFPYLALEKVETVEQLSGKWCPQEDYGQEIIKMVKKIESTEIKNAIKVTVDVSYIDEKIEELKKEIIEAMK